MCIRDRVVASTTGIPVKKIAQEEYQKLKNLEVELHKRVIGQNEAIEAVSKACLLYTSRCV